VLGRGARPGFDAGGRNVIEVTDHPAPCRGQSGGLVAQHDPLDLRLRPLLERSRNAGEPLAGARGHAVPRETLDIGQVGEPSGDAAAKSPPPACRVPVSPPCEQRARGSERIDGEGTVIEARSVIELGEARLIGE
jgi:hypothetical protein